LVFWAAEDLAEWAARYDEYLWLHPRETVLVIGSSCDSFPVIGFIA